MLLTPFLQLIVERRASDLFVSGGAVPQIRLEGRTRAVGKRELTPEEVERVAQELMGPAERRRFEQDWEVDFACRIEGLGRFRVNVFRQRGEVALVLRLSCVDRTRSTCGRRSAASPCCATRAA